MTEQEKRAVMLTPDDIETLLRALREAPLPMPHYFGEAPVKENEAMLKKIRHVTKALMETGEEKSKKPVLACVWCGGRELTLGEMLQYGILVIHQQCMHEARAQLSFGDVTPQHQRRIWKRINENADKADTVKRALGL